MRRPIPAALAASRSSPSSASSASPKNENFNAVDAEVAQRTLGKIVRVAREGEIELSVLRKVHEGWLPDYMAVAHTN